VKTKFGFLSALMAAALVVGAGAPAKAITLTVTSVDSTTVSLTGGASGDRAEGHLLSVSDNGGSTADVIGNTIDMASRYISTAAADRASATGGSTATAGITTNYTLTFTVSGAFSGEQWSAKINTVMRGGLTALDDASGTASAGSTNVSNITGKLNGSVDSLLGLTVAASQGGTSSTSGTQVNVNASGTKTVTGTGNGFFTLNFAWTTSASSPQGLIIGGDEEAARFGFNNPLGGASADDYAGPSGASRANGLSANPALGDGHFINAVLTVNVVPEPSTLAMAGIGAIGLGLAAWRRRRAA
jgi:hypothetical protein